MTSRYFLLLYAVLVSSPLIAYTALPRSTFNLYVFFESIFVIPLFAYVTFHMREGMYFKLKTRYGNKAGAALFAIWQMAPSATAVLMVITMLLSADKVY